MRGALTQIAFHRERMEGDLRERLWWRALQGVLLDGEVGPAGLRGREVHVPRGQRLDSP